MIRPQSTRTARFPAGKLLLFSAVTTAGFFIIVELLLWAAGVDPIPYDEDPFVGFASMRPVFVGAPGPDGGLNLVTAPYKASWFNYQSFPKDKPAGVYRVFSLGGSTTYGRPYTDPLSFSGRLREYLPLADPAREYEVINAGGISYASYRVAVLMEELLEYEPDLFLVYVGHNEFLERRTYAPLVKAPRVVTTLAAWASRTRLFAAGRPLVAALTGSATPEKPLLPGEVDTILEHSVGPGDYHRDDALREQVFEHFRFNLNRLVDMARSAGAEIVFITPVSNMKDCSPFKSQLADGLDADARARFEADFAAAARSSAGEDWERAAVQLERALAIDDRHAEAQYRYGLALYKLGRFEEAKASLQRAIEEDICPLRAPQRIVDIVAEVAASRGVPLVDFASEIERRSPHGITGSEQFLDHVHLNAEGYGLLARSIVETLARASLLDLSSSWNEENISAASDRVLEKLDRPAYGESLLNLAKVFDWAGKYDDAERLARQARDILGDAPEAYSVLGHSALAQGDLEAAIRYLRQAALIQPDFVPAYFDLGTALYEAGHYEDAARSFRIVLKLAPISYEDAHANLGASLHALGQLDEAISEYRVALNLKPDRFDVRNNLALALLARGQAEEAIDQFRGILAHRPSAEAHFNLGAALELRGNLNEAAGQFLKATEMKPDYPEAYNSLGLNLLLMGRAPEAIEPLQEAIRLRPDFPEAHDNLGSACRLTGRDEAAVRHFRDAARLRPDWAPPLQHLARVLVSSSDSEIRDPAEAVRLAERAVELTHKRDADALDVLAKSYAAAGRYPDALRAARLALARYEEAGDGAAAAKLRQRIDRYDRGLAPANSGR